MSHNNSSSGFTIIEVLIVLAIAGLIMLIVFLAVPALNRSSTNNSIKADARNVVAAYKEIMINRGNQQLNTGDSTTTTTDAYTVLIAANIDPNSPTVINILAGPALGNTQAVGNTTIATSKIAIRTHAKCRSPDSNIAEGAAATSAALFYWMATSNPSVTQYQCLDI